jgi:hypothetical protein
MKIANSLIINSDFITVFDDLLKKEMPAKQCMQVVTSFDELVAQHKVLRRTQKAIVERFAKLDKKGVAEQDATGKILYKSAKDEEECKSELSVILSDTTEISLSSKIKISEDERMTPLKLYLLKDIVEIVE